MTTGSTFGGAGALALATTLTGLAAHQASAQDAGSDKVFNRIATYLVCENTSCDRETVEETSAEIIAATENGETLLYTDSPASKLGFVDITDPAAPHGLGAVDVGGEPTSVAVAGPYALVGVNTSESFTEPSGFLAVYDIDACLDDIASCAPATTLDLGGQPDSVAVSPDQRYGAVAIENERDEDITVDGVEGGLPQLPGGFLQIVDLAGGPAEWTVRPVDLSGLSDYAPDDPEPEYVAINRENHAAVSLQENNWLIIVDLRSGTIVHDNDAGRVALEDIDAVENSLIDLIYDFSALAEDGDGPTRLPREPDGLDWSTTKRLVTANEGDLFGGTRGFTVFSGSGSRVRFDPAEGVEYATVRVGHFPEDRADAKGSEPEGIETSQFDTRLIFVGLERSNLVLVYRDGQVPELLQQLPTGINPEGLLALPERGLFIASAEDDEDVRSQINIFAWEEGPATYPQIVSADDENGLPIGWGALSGLSGDVDDAGVVCTVHDSVYDQSRIYVVDVTKTPAEIVQQAPLLKDGETVDFDLEGIVQRPDRSFWLVSEGSGSVDDPERPVETPNLLIEADGEGQIIQEVELPTATNDLQRRFGFEGVAVTGAGDDEQVYVAFQREWVDDPEGLVRIGRYTPSTGTWSFFYYPLDPVESPAGGWVGLSEIVAIDDATFWILERDNQGGPDARIKRIYRVSIEGVEPAEEGEPFPTLEKNQLLDFLPLLQQATNGWVPDKPEGLTIAADGQVYLVTDNDGVDGATGETLFLRLGDKDELN